MDSKRKHALDSIGSFLKKKAVRTRVSRRGLRAYNLCGVRRQGKRGDQVSFENVNYFFGQALAERMFHAGEPMAKVVAQLKDTETSASPRRAQAGVEFSTISGRLRE